MRSQRKVMPVLALLGFEISAIVGLQYLGSMESMQVPWGNLSTWLSSSSLEDLVAPIVRVGALALAYWLFVSTALVIIAQISRVPAAIKATNMLALPSVRRVVDGAMVVSIAATSVVGGTATAAFAQTPSSGDITTTIAADSGSMSVPTPEVGEPIDASGETTTSTAEPVDGDEEDAAPVESDDDLVTTSSLLEGMEPLETTTTAAPTTTTDEPETTTSTTSLSPSPGSSWVPTPQLGAPGETTTTTTAAPEAPSDPVVESDTSVTSETDAEEPVVETEVLGESAHRVVAGENLWTISRDAIASSTGRDASDVSESEVRSYWLQVIDANRDNLRSGDPHWIFAGESINLPALDAAQ